MNTTLPNPFRGNYPASIPQSGTERTLYAIEVMKVAARGCPVFWGDKGDNKLRNLIDAAYADWNWTWCDYSLPTDAEADFGWETPKYPAKWDETLREWCFVTT